MRAKPRITRIEVTQFTYELPGIGREPTVAIPIYEPGGLLRATANAIREYTHAGLTGEYVGGSATEYSALPQFAGSLIADQLPQATIWSLTKLTNRTVSG